MMANQMIAQDCPQSENNVQVQQSHGPINDMELNQLLFEDMPEIMDVEVDIEGKFSACIHKPDSLPTFKLLFF